MGRSSEPIPISSPHNLKIDPGRHITRRYDQRYKTWIVSWKIMVHICCKSNQRRFFMYCKKWNKKLLRMER